MGGNIALTARKVSPKDRRVSKISGFLETIPSYCFEFRKFCFTPCLDNIARDSRDVVTSKANSSAQDG
jgi:hypothetical protein